MLKEEARAELAAWLRSTIHCEQVDKALEVKKQTSKQTTFLKKYTNPCINTYTIKSGKQKNAKVFSFVLHALS